jgi:spore coat protein U-like protein
MSMNVMKLIVRRLSIAILPLFLPSLAQAQCTVTATDMNFGQVNLITTQQPVATSTITATCNFSGIAATYRLCISLGGGTGASGTTRRMQNGSNFLTYNLFRDLLYTTPWGSRSQTGFGNPVQLDLTPLLTPPATQTFTVFGRIGASQSGAAGGLYSSSFTADASYTYIQAPGLGDSCSTISSNPGVAPFVVRANVNRTCAVSTAAVNFGSQTSLSSALSALGNLYVTCTNALPYTISLGNGISGSSPAARLMRLQNAPTGPTITYGLYRDSAYSQVWGSAVGATVPGTGNGATQTYPVYARIQSQTTPQAGLYSDTVVVTVTY